MISHIHFIDEVTVVSHSTDADRLILNTRDLLWRRIQGYAETSVTDAILTLGRQSSRAANRVARSSWAGRSSVGWLAPVLLLATWQVCASIGLISSGILPNPTDVARAAWRLTLSGELANNVTVSAARAFAGLFIGGGTGLTSAFAIGLSRWSDTLTDTPLQRVRNVPHLALIPLVIV